MASRDPASDIYALGLLAQEMLTAEGPLSGGAMQELVLGPSITTPRCLKASVRLGGAAHGDDRPEPRGAPTAGEVADLARELRSGPVPADSAVVAAVPADSAAVAVVGADAEPVTALRAVNQARETSARRRRPPLWAWVTHYH